MRHFICGLIACCALNSLVHAQQGQCPTHSTCTETTHLEEYLSRQSGVGFYTLCAEEKALLAIYPELFEKTGVSFRVGANDTPGVTPSNLTRYFFQSLSADAVSRHFYTVLDEENALLATVPLRTDQFLRCDEGSRGKAIRPNGITGTGAAIDVSAATCPKWTRPVWRVLDQNPLRHRWTARYDEVLGSPSSSVDEGVRLCIADNAASAKVVLTPIASIALNQTGDIAFRVESELASLGVVTEAEGTILLPDSLTFLQGDSFECNATGQTVNCRWENVAKPRASPLTIKVRRSKTGSSNDRVIANAWVPTTATLTLEPSKSSYFAAKACTAIGVPYFGCALAAVPLATTTP